MGVEREWHGTGDRLDSQGYHSVRLALRDAAPGISVSCLSPGKRLPDTSLILEQQGRRAGNAARGTFDGDSANDRPPLHDVGECRWVLPRVTRGTASRREARPQARRKGQDQTPT